MAWVTPHFTEIWESGTYVGEHTPMAVVQVQLGHWQTAWHSWDGPRVDAKIWGEGNYGPDNAQTGHWRPIWFPDTDWIDLPNLSSIKRTRDFKANGMAVCEIVVDAQDFVAKIGALGDAYHVIAPGWLAPTRNYVPELRPNPGWETNDFAPAGQRGRVNDSVRIRVWQGYGQPETDGTGTPPRSGGTNGAWTFNGLIDDVDLDGDPNTITITARSGKLLTDQRTFRASKAVQLKDPIAFYDELAAMTTHLVAHHATASSHVPGHSGVNVLDRPRKPYDASDPAYSTTWRSRGKISHHRVEWVEVRLPQGRYNTFWLQCDPGVVAYVGIKAKKLRHYQAHTGADDGSADYNTLDEDFTPPSMDERPISEGWVDLGPTVKGTNGGWKYIKSFRTAGDGLNKNVQLGHDFELGPDSVLRVGFKLQPGVRPARMNVGDLHGLRRGKVKKEIKRAQFILVPDASEVVKVVLRWAGFEEWDVEEAGVRLSDGTDKAASVSSNVNKQTGRLVFNRTTHLQDIIAEIEKQLGFVFFIADPKDGESWGVPTFRRDASMLRDNNYIAAHLNESTMLTGLKVKHSDEDKARPIRVRGKTTTARHGGIPLGGDSIRRLEAYYNPPWNDRSAGVLRHIVYTLDELVTYAQCLYGACIIGMNAALEMHTAVAEIPANMLIELDDQVTVLDEPTATNSRLWVVKTEDTMELGEHSSWKMTVEGSLLDTQDLQQVIAQVEGRQPMTTGLDEPPWTPVIVPSIDWRHVVDPHTGRESGYMSPIKSASRPPRHR